MPARNSPIILALTDKSLALASQVAAVIDGRILTKKDLPLAIKAYQDGAPIIGITAIAILIRHFAPQLQDKHRDAPLLWLDGHGGAIVPLIGAHHGGMKLAQKIAHHLKITFLESTASPFVLGVNFDEPPQGWTLISHEHTTSLIRRLVDGEPCHVHHRLTWLSHLHKNGTASLKISSGWRLHAPNKNQLHYAEKRLAIGVGCVRHFSAQSLIKNVQKLLAQNQLEPAALAGFFSLDVKEDEEALHQSARFFNVEAGFFTAQELKEMEGHLSAPSREVESHIGVKGVCEAAALRAAGAGAKLIIPKIVIKEGATLAVALARRTLTQFPAKKRGALAIIGIGAGGGETMTLRAFRHLSKASHIVGFDKYLNLLDDMTQGKKLFPYAIGFEQERVHKALSLASQGHSVALISSGDAGIYGLASPAIECLADAPPEFHRVNLTIIPGATAMTEASARHGALLGHDTAILSLSDLLTPQKIIKERLTAALKAQFVIALYNPSSTKRKKFYQDCLALIKKERAPHTPIIIAQHLGRANEQSHLTTLKHIDQEEIDMNHIILIGSKHSRQVTRPHAPPLVFTPRAIQKEHS